MTMAMASRAMAAGLVVAALAGCGVRDSCAEGDACGGPLPGTWDAQNFCSTSGATRTTLLGCPDVVAFLEAPRIASMTFGEDLRYEASLVGLAGSRVDFPASCLQATSCEKIQAGLLASPPTGADDFREVRCSMRDDGQCGCRFDRSPELRRGNYRTEGNTLVLDGPDGRQDRIDYCAEGGLRLRTEAFTVGLGSLAQGKASFNVELVRR
jgi:hypothetical protein